MCYKNRVNFCVINRVDFCVINQVDFCVINRVDFCVINRVDFCAIKIRSIFCAIKIESIYVLSIKIGPIFVVQSQIIYTNFETKGAPYCIAMIFER